MSIFDNILASIHVYQLNILVLLGLALFGGVLGGRVFQKLKVPQVVGYIVIGILIGQSGLKIVDEKLLTMLEPLNYFALGLIGFMVGGELHRSIFTKHGRQFMTILFCEGITPFLLVTILVGFVGSIFFDWRIAWGLGLLFGAIASATDPATTTEVLREYRTRGPLSKTVLGIVALDDGLALILFAIASSIAGSLSGITHESLLKTFIHPIYDIGGSILLGTVLGFTLSKILNKYTEKERLLAFTIGIVLLVVGLSLTLNVEMLLTAMTVGIIVVNFSPQKSKGVFKLVGGFTPPIYVLFFVLIGAKLNLSHMGLSTSVLVLVYLFGTMAGKVIGSKFGARIARSPKTVQKYLPLALFSQAGVAIGLSILAAQYFPGAIGNTIIIVITATTFILQLVGPYLTKVAVTRAKEVGLNVTEEDLIFNTKAKDVMDANPPLIINNMPLTNILKIFSSDTNLYYPVVDKTKKLLGIITVDNLKNIFMETDLNELLLAVDVMEPVLTTVSIDSPVQKVKEALNRYNLEYIPVTNSENKLIGFIEERTLDRIISTKLMELQREVDM
ncbi:MAG: cation:proton antiporter [Candidatus Gygaella obscura]|nr:cation:proton antiporter [Candidatus Gygaella obscura]